MLKKIKSVVLTFATLSIALTPALVAVPAYADGNNSIIGGLCTGSTFKVSDQPGDVSACDQGNANTQTLNGLLTSIINIFSAVVGVIAVLMIIVGGLRYITSGGDSGKVTGAKTTIIYALIGLVIVALSQLVVHFVLNQANGIITGGGAQ